jgi:small subunit ribosomal protein S1
VEALCHNSEIPGFGGRKDDPGLPIGEEMDFKIIRMVESEKKIGLSLRGVAEDEERSRLEDYQRQAAAATMTIEEVVHMKGRAENR